MKRHWYWDWYIDADHPDLNLLSEEPGGRTIASKDRDPVPVFMLVDQLDCFPETLRADQREDGTEYFFAIDSHTWANPIKQGATQEKSFRRHACLSTVYKQLGAFLLAKIEIRSNPCHMAAVYYWPHRGVFGVTGTNAQPMNAWAKP